MRRLFTVLAPALALLSTACGGGGDEPAGGSAAPVASAASAPASSPSSTATATACDSATGRVLRVGPGRTYATPSAAAAAVASGDVVRIAAGDYHGDVATWSASNLTICGDGGRARLFADGKSAQGKAIWVVGGANVTVDGIEFHDAKVADRNGAGIRIEGTSLTVLNSGFFDNEDGMLGGAGATIVVDRSEFARNGFGDGFSHNLYIGAAESLVVTSSWFHEAKVGHQLKSRARQTRIENSYFMDGPTGTASYLLEFPNGGAVTLRGNLLHKGPMAQNPTAVSFGAEGLTWPTNTLSLVHDTIVMTRSGGTFLSVPAATQSLTLTANLFAGTGTPTMLAGGFAIGNAAQSAHATASAAAIAGADSIAAPSFWPNASLLATTGIAGIPDPTYAHDAPAPFASRAVAGASRRSGALQAAP